MIIRHVMELIVNPFCLCLMLFLFFIILCYLQVNRVVVTSGFCLVFILLVLCSTGWLAKNLTYYLEDQYHVVTTLNQNVRWIVVFSGGLAEIPKAPPNAMLTTVSIDRLVEGVRLYRELPQAKLLLSGGGVTVSTSEATRLAQVVSWFDIPKANVVLETMSTNTASEAKAIKSIVQQEPFYLVTSAVHMPRAIKLCRAQGLHPIAAPTDFSTFWQRGWERTYIPSSYNLHYLSVALHEVLGNLLLSI